MFIETFHTALACARIKHSLSLRKLATLTGINHPRIWRLEQGLCFPTNEERDKLQRVLISSNGKLFYLAHKPKSFFSRLHDRGRRYRESPEAYFPPCDRLSRQRYRAASRQYPDVCLSLTSQIRARPDIEDVNCFCEMLSIGSSLECIFIMTLLARGANPAFLAPDTLFPRLPNPVVCPETRETVGHRPIPCLLTKEGVYFPQISFATPRTYTVDFLRHGRELEWSVIEIDGMGHESMGDRERTDAIKMRFVRYSENDVLGQVKEYVAA